MANECIKHGWRHAQKRCPNCYPKVIPAPAVPRKCEFGHELVICDSPCGQDPHHQDSHYNAPPCQNPRPALVMPTPSERKVGHSGLRWNKGEQKLEKFDPHPEAVPAPASPLECQGCFHKLSVHGASGCFAPYCTCRREGLYGKPTAPASPHAKSSLSKKAHEPASEFEKNFNIPGAPASPAPSEPTKRTECCEGDAKAWCPLSEVASPASEPALTPMTIKEIQLQMLRQISELVPEHPNQGLVERVRVLVENFKARGKRCEELLARAHASEALAESPAPQLPAQPVSGEDLARQADEWFADYPEGRIETVGIEGVVREAWAAALARKA